MKAILRRTSVCLVIAAVAVAATSSSRPRLTPQRLADLALAGDAPAPKDCTIEITDLQVPGLTTPRKPEALRVSLATQRPPVSFQLTRELRYPTEFDPARPVSETEYQVVPTTPTVFETIDAGWKFHLSAKPQGKLVEVIGIAEYVEVESVDGGYGEIAGPVFSEKGLVITPNKLLQPKVQTTSTRFHLYARPGEKYEVNLYRGGKAEKHTFTVTPE